MHIYLQEGMLNNNLKKTIQNKLTPTIVLKNITLTLWHKQRDENGTFLSEYKQMRNGWETALEHQRFCIFHFCVFPILFFQQKSVYDSRKKKTSDGKYHWTYHLQISITSIILTVWK